MIEDGVAPQDACEEVIRFLGTRATTSAGLLAIDARGNVGCAFRGGSLSVFGPDGRLYLSQINGTIRVLTVARYQLATIRSGPDRALSRTESGAIRASSTPRAGASRTPASSPSQPCARPAHRLAGRARVAGHLIPEEERHRPA